jgi:flavin-dependent dehydrogenase
VTLCEGTRAEGLLLEEGRVAGVALRGADGARREVRARVVVGAAGKFSSLARWVGAASYREEPAMRPLYFAYYRGLTPLPEPAAEFFFQTGRIGFIFPMEPGIDCLVLEIQPEEFAHFRADPEAFEADFGTLPGMAARLAGAQREGPVYGTRGVENYLRVPFGPGWALTGDAAYCKDPSTGFGIADAFNQAFMLAEALGATLDGADWETTMTAYQCRRDAAALPGYEGTLAFTRTGDLPAESLAWLRALLSSPANVRLFGFNAPAALAAPGILSDSARAALTASARAFGARAEKSPVPGAAG